MYEHAVDSTVRGAKFYRCAFQVNAAHYAKTFRGDDRASEAAMEDRKREGYF